MQINALISEFTQAVLKNLTSGHHVNILPNESTDQLLQEPDKLIQVTDSKKKVQFHGLTHEPRICHKVQRASRNSSSPHLLVVAYSGTNDRVMIKNGALKTDEMLQATPLHVGTEYCVLWANS
jgi:hypothetical protein